MGSGAWSTDVYASRASTRAATGTSAFDHSKTVLSTTPRSQIKPHANLDPNGVNVRESRDSDEHPNSVGITVLFDVTGSMLEVPQITQQKLPDLLELVQYKHYVDDAQFLFGAIGDATCDPAPLQVGQFESDNRMEENLENILLVGGGGGSYHESYELAFYFMARHTAMDCVEKRGHKGYLFVIGDEHAYPAVKPAEVSTVIGDTLPQPIPTDEIIRELQDKFQVFFIIPGQSMHYSDPELKEYWENLVGKQNVLMVDRPEAIAEVIALQVGIMEDTIKLEEGMAHLKERGVDDSTMKTVTKAFAGV